MSVCFTGAKIDEIHSKWFGNYELLEGNHGYIQWYHSSICYTVFFNATFTNTESFEHAH